jgi:transposase
VRYQAAGADGLRLGYQGSNGYLAAGQREALAQWVAAHETLTLEQLRDHVDTEYGVV